MISNIIENSLHNVSVTLITDFFIIAIVVLLLLSLFWTKKDKHHEFTSYAPTLLTSVGILGTFTGIVVGLLAFDVNNIDGSIGHLLSGLKVAFITSLVGMLSSIILKFLTSSNIISPPKNDNIKEDVSIEDLYSVMSNQNQNIVKIQELLSDNADSSLIGQIKLIRSDISDNYKTTNKNLENIYEPLKQLNSLYNIEKSINISNESLQTLQNNQTKHKDLFENFSNELWKQLENFAEILSKSATEQIIAALKNVIQEFNQKLAEQFGENFKELNSAVKDLVVWQDNYKNQLLDMKKQFNLSVNSISDMEKSIELISTNSKSIPESMDNLSNVITVNQNQIEELDRHLGAFKDIRDKAVEAIPEIRSQIDTTIKGIHEASLGLIDGVTTSTNKISSTISQSSEDFANNVSATNGALIDSSDTLKKSSIEIKDHLTLTTEDISKHIREIIENLSSNSKELSNSLKDVINSLESELSKTNTNMADNLKSITDNFSNNTQDINKTLSNTASELQNNMESLSKEQQKQTTKILTSLDQTIEKTLQDTSDSLSKQIETMDKVTEQEINNVMNSMGKSLGSITKKFTDDYQLLVNEMQKVIEANR